MHAAPRIGDPAIGDPAIGDPPIGDPAIDDPPQRIRGITGPTSSRQARSAP